MSKEPAKGGKCKYCGIELPVPAWTTCMLHDSRHTKKIVKQPFVKLERFTKRPFQSYLGYTICIPFNDFIKARDLIIDPDTYAIIGWR